MQGYTGVLWCIAWIVGLLTTQSPWWMTGIVAIVFPCIGITARKLRPASHQVQPWLIASVIVLIALAWYQFRTPQPGAFDISRFIEPIDRTTIQITGTVDELPRTTRSGKTKLWLTVQSLDAGDLNSRLTIPPDKANGKLYVTISDRRPSFAPGTQVQLEGKLYSPKGAQNPGGFDFKKRLAIEGCFAGFSANDFTIIAPPKQTWGLWQVQQRIVQAQMVGLPGEEGLLLSAMVLGNRAVDLPGDMQDAFTKIGMSHALAASGFQVSLTLSVVLALCSRASKQVKGIAGGIAIVILIGLAGAQPAILRAGVMGAAVLVAIVAEKTVKPIGSLLFASVLLLVWNPLWIWDLGFQLSALATLGLLVTSEPLQKYLDWLPSPIAAAFATPIAAYIWVLPLQLYAFGLVSPYSIPANVLTTVLISIISLGGMVSALLAAIVPMLGSFSAGLLHYPIVALLGIVEQMGRLPGSQWAAGKISVGVLIALYGFLGVAVSNSKFIQPKRYWILSMTIVALLIIFGPAWQQAQTRIQITALTTTRQPILVVQAPGKVVLVNTGDRSVTEMTITPFLQKNGINQIDALIQLHSADPDAVQALRNRLTIRQVLTTNDFQELKLGQITLRTIPLPQPVPTSRVKNQPEPIAPALQLQLPGQAPWILTHKLPRKLVPDTLTSTPAVLWWSGGKLPEMPLVGAIAYGKTLRPEVAQTLDQRGIATFHLAKDGAVQWSPREGFKTSFSMDDAEFARL